MGILTKLFKATDQATVDFLTEKLAMLSIKYSQLEDRYKNLFNNHSLLIQKNHKEKCDLEKHIAELKIELALVNQVAEERYAECRNLTKKLRHEILSDTGFDKTRKINDVQYNYRADGRVVAKVAGIPTTVHQLVLTIESLAGKKL
jgi:hypothetical protein